MAEDQAAQDLDARQDAEAEAGAKAQRALEKKGRREIKGNLPYTVAPGVLKRALDGIIQAERPDKFSGAFVESVLGITGGSSRSVAPMLKKMGFIGSDGSPSDLYSKFRSDSSRSVAAFDGLRTSFHELFRRNEYIYKDSEQKIIDLIAEITGLQKRDAIVRYIYNTFDTIRGYIDEKELGKRGASASTEAQPSALQATEEQGSSNATPRPAVDRPIGLAYNINITLPETDRIEVFNAIFKSLRDNLLK